MNALLQHIDCPISVDGVSSTIDIDVHNVRFNSNPQLLTTNGALKIANPIGVENDNTPNIKSLSLLGSVVTVLFLKVPTGEFNVLLKLLYSGV